MRGLILRGAAAFQLGGISIRRFVENGSFNYTERAQRKNYENIQVHDDAGLAANYGGNFQSIWDAASPEVSHAVRPIVRVGRAFRNRLTKRQ